MSQTNPPIFSMVGTTSVGKSEAIFDLAEYVSQHNLAAGLDIISADSRQVYRGIEILTGSDLPKNFEMSDPKDKNSLKYFYHKNTRIYGLSHVEVSDEWSVAQFNTYAQKVLQKSQEEGRIVCVVGGTGLYHEHLLTRDPQLTIPPDEKVRVKAATLTVTELQTWLQNISPERLEEMNNSDRNNPRRLQRSIEVALAKQQMQFDSKTNAASENFQHIFLGLTLPPEELHAKIKERVVSRFENGAVQEVEKILKFAKPISPQVQTTLGFFQIKEYVLKKITADECIVQWTQADISYSKRQITWWKHDKQVTWFDKNRDNWKQELLQKFHSHIPGK